MTTQTPHAFDAAIALTALGGDHFEGHTSDAYWNMVGPFGGITAATALHAVMQHPARRGQPVALTVNYAAALTRGRFVVVARAARMSMQINLGKGTLESLERELLPVAVGNPQKPIYRRLLIEQLKQALVTHARSQQHAALLFIDLDNFKTLNDTLGHETGDQLLQQVAQRLLACVRGADTVARLGGDEFVVMLQGLSSKPMEAAADAEHVGHKILDAFAPSFALSEREYRSTPSIGITLFGRGTQSVEDLLKQADLAMYQAKASGRNTLRMFDEGMQAAVDARAAMESDLRTALDQKRFMLHYQPVVGSNGQITGAEALVRWLHPERGQVAPGHFIPVAEATRLIVPLGLWVLEEACAQLARWAAGEATRHLTLAVNVSAHQFMAPDFVAQVEAALQRSGADPERLKLELTESLLADNVEDVILKMTALRVRGVAGLRVVDAGAMPTITSGNTNSPTLMMAERAAELRGTLVIDRAPGGGTRVVATLPLALDSPPAPPEPDRWTP